MSKELRLKTEIHKWKPSNKLKAGRMRTFKWQKGLDNLAKETVKKKVEKTLKIEIDDEAFDRLYGHISHPIEIKKNGQKIAVRIISQFGEESTKILTLKS